MKEAFVKAGKTQTRFTIGKKIISIKKRRIGGLRKLKLFKEAFKIHTFAMKNTHIVFYFELQEVPKPFKETN